MTTSETLGRLWEFVVPLAAGEDLEVVEIEFRREGRSGLVLRVFLDKVEKEDEGDAPGLDALSRVSRELSDILDVHGVIENAYTLEVSSPGVNRPLRKPEHFARYVGQRIRVRTGEMVNGRKNFLGHLNDAAGDGVVMEQDGHQVFIPFSLIVKANVEYEWASP